MALPHLRRAGQLVRVSDTTAKRRYRFVGRSGESYIWESATVNRWNWRWYRTLSRALHGCPMCGCRIAPCDCGTEVDAAVARMLAGLSRP